MTVTEGLMRPGSAIIQFVPDIPSKEVADVMAIIDEDNGGPGGHIVITPEAIVTEKISDADLLDTALWTGRVTARRSMTQIECLGISSWLDSFTDAELNRTAGTISQWLGDCLLNSITAGTVTATGTSNVTRVFDIARQTRRQVLDTVAALGGWEYRFNPDFTVDAGTTANLFRTTASESTPLVALMPEGGSTDWVYKSFTAKIAEPRLNLGDISTKVVVLGAGGYQATWTGTPSLKTWNGNTPEIVTTKVAGTETAANADTLADRVGDERSARWRATATTDVDLIRKHVTPGDSVYVYDHVAGLLNEADQIELRGEVISPLKKRLIELTWPITRGMGVYLRSNASTPIYVDLSQWVVNEGTTAFWVIGDAEWPALAGRVANDIIDIGNPGGDGGTNPTPPIDGGGGVGFDCTTPAALSSSPYNLGSLIAFVPKACAGQVYEQVSGLIGAKGPAFGEWIEDGSNIAIQSAAAGVVASGNAPQLEYYDDTTISVRVSIGVDDQNVRLMSIAGLRIDAVGSGSAGWYPKLSATNNLGDEVTITDTTERDLDTAYLVTATFDSSTGDVALYVNDLPAGTAQLDNPANRASQGDFWYLGLPEDSWITNGAVWNAVVAPDVDYNDYLDTLAPTHYWKMDDTGEPIADYGSATASPRGIRAGTPTFETAIGSFTGIDLDGSTEWLDRYSTAETITDDAPFSVFGIIQPDTFPASGVEVIMSTSQSGLSPFSRGVLFGVTNGGGLYCNIASGTGTANSATSAGGVVSTAVHTVGLTYDGSELRVFADGVEVASVAHSAGVRQDIVMFGYHQGNTTASAGYFDGTIAEFSWFNNTTLTDAEHLALHNSTGI